jgi:hypothetical protein
MQVSKQVLAVCKRRKQEREEKNQEAARERREQETEKKAPKTSACPINPFQPSNVKSFPFLR